MYLIIALILFVGMFFFVGFSAIAWKDFIHWCKGRSQETTNTPEILAAKIFFIIADFILAGFIIWAVFFPH